MPSDFQDLADMAFDTIQETVGRETVTYKPKGGGSFEVVGPFSDHHVDVDPDTERLISSNAFTFGLQLKDVPIKNFVAKKGDRIIFNNQTYRVIDSQEDGVPGVSVFLILHKDC